MAEPLPQDEALKEDLKAWTELDKINQSAEFNTFFDLQVNTIVNKMLACFSGKGPENWDEFCKIRGEVVATLSPIQYIRDSTAMKAKIKEQINQIYNKQI